MQSDSSVNKVTRKAKFMEELREFFILFLYLALLLGALRAYTELTLAEYHVNAVMYGYTLVEALVLAKILMIGDLFGIGKKVPNAPLIVTTTYRTISFIVFVAVFVFFEHVVDGLVHREAFTKTLQEIAGKGKDEILARLAILFIAFFPLIALTEVARRLGRRKLADLVFKRQLTDLSNPQ